MVVTLALCDNYYAWIELSYSSESLYVDNADAHAVKSGVVTNSEDAGAPGCLHTRHAHIIDWAGLQGGGKWASEKERFWKMSVVVLCSTHKWT